MCSSVQPKMFAGAQPLGTGGTAAPPIVYPGGKPPNFDAGDASNFPGAATAATPAPPTPSPMNFLNGGAGSLLRYAGRFNYGGGGQLGGARPRPGLPGTVRFS